MKVSIIYLFLHFIKHFTRYISALNSLHVVVSLFDQTDTAVTTTSFPSFAEIDLLAILQKSLDREIFLYIFICEARLSGIRTSLAIACIREFYKMQ